MKKDITYTIYISINGVDVPWSSLSEEEKRDMRNRINDKALKSIGYTRVDKTA